MDGRDSYTNKVSPFECILGIGALTHRVRALRVRVKRQLRSDTASAILRLCCSSHFSRSLHLRNADIA